MVCVCIFYDTCVQTNHTTSERYRRQMTLPDFGNAGQEALADAHVVFVGVGALGCVAADMLCRAGVGAGDGCITLIDRDVVDLTNLQRQVLYDTSHVGTPKVIAAAERIAQINPDVRTHPVIADMTYANIEQVVLRDGKRPVVILDGTDNFETRLLINDLCVRDGIPWIYCGCVGTRGMVMPIVPAGSGKHHACLRCIVPEAPAPGSMPTCETAGVLAPAVGVAASVMTAEAMKIIMGKPDRVNRTLLEFDVWSNERRRFETESLADARCVCCVKREFGFLQGRQSSASLGLCGRDAVQVMPAGASTLDLVALARALGAHGDVRSHPAFAHIRFAEDRALEMTVFADGRAIVTGTRDETVARQIYSRYVGM